MRLPAGAAAIGHPHADATEYQPKQQAYKSNDDTENQKKHSDDWYYDTEHDKQPANQHHDETHKAKAYTLHPFPYILQPVGLLRPPRLEAASVFFFLKIF